MSGARVTEGQRVRTEDGPGVAVVIWHEHRIAYGIPRRETWITVELDGPDHWRRVYAPADLELIEEEVSA